MRAFKRTLLIGLSLILLISAGVILFRALSRQVDESRNIAAPAASADQRSDFQKKDNPLSGIKLYADKSRPINFKEAEYAGAGKNAEASLLGKITGQPNSAWLVGPTDSDTSSGRDYALVERITQETSVSGTVPIYVLYAIPKRDACAGYSKGGHSNAADYSGWISGLLSKMQGKAVFILEPDAVAQTIEGSCLSNDEIENRLNTIRQAVETISASGKSQAVYIDAGHSEWIKDPKKLVEPLKKAGARSARGISANVSFFEETGKVAAWSAELARYLGEDKAAVIDTSRNGRGVPPGTAQGEERWCNPSGRGLGESPVISPGLPRIDAYLWVKNIGESDGTCRGYPPAGTFVPEIALELAMNSKP